jgi:PAS domain S-box-containing protein
MGGIPPGTDAPQQGNRGRLHELQQVLKAVPMTILRIDPDGRIVYANERTQEHLGVDSTAATNRTYDDAAWELRAPDGTPIADEALPFARVMATGEPVDGVRHRVQHPDGSDRVVEVSGVPVFDSANEIESAVFAIRDVTDQHERKQEVDRYRKFLSESPDITFVVGEDGVVEYQSGTSGVDGAFEHPELDGETPFEYVHPDDRDRLRDDFEALVAAGVESTVETEYRIQQPDGTYRWLAGRAINYLGTEPIDGILLVTRDIHQRKETETKLGRYERTIRELQETTQRLLETDDPESAAIVALEGIKSVFNFSTSGIWLASDDRTRLEPVAMSEQGESLIDSQPTYTAEVDSLSWDAYESQTARRIDDMTSQPGRANPETPIRSELIVPIGEFGLVNIGSTAIGAFSDDDLRSVQIWSNTVESALARLEQIDRLQEREDALTRERDRLDDFASIISHDLRNMVNIAEGHLGVAQAEDDIAKLDPVDRALDRMDDIMDDTLTLARQGETVDEREPVDISVVIANCLDVIDGKNATFTVEDECRIMADPDRLAHIFENLFRNAVDHGGADVTVTVGRTDDGLYVADTGPGVPPEDRDTIFDSGYTTREEGTGLGLRIVEQVVAAHGWSITVTESAAGGARFEISGVDFV